MVRPQKGERLKKNANFTVDPIEWELFKENCKNNLPDPSASAHLETLIRAENARFAGEGGATNPAIDEAARQRQLRNVERERLDIIQICDKANTRKPIRQLSKDYGLTRLNGTQVIRRLVLDQDTEGSIVYKFINGGKGNETEVQMLIRLIEIRDEENEINRKLRELQKKKYSRDATEVEAKPSPQLEQPMEEEAKGQTQTTLTPVAKEGQNPGTDIEEAEPEPDWEPPPDRIYIKDDQEEEKEIED